MNLSIFSSTISRWPTCPYWFNCLKHTWVSFVLEILNHALHPFSNNCYWLTFQFQNLFLKNTLQQHFMKLDCNELLTTVFTNCIFTTVFQEYFLMSCSSACHPCWPWPLSHLHSPTIFWNCILLGWPFCVFALILLSFLYVLWWKYCVSCTTSRVYIFSFLILIFVSFWIACGIFNFVFPAALAFLVLCAFSNIFSAFWFSNVTT